jgi:phospholipase/carboxylesterase
MSLDLDPDAVLWSAPAAERDGRALLVVMHGRGSDEQDLFSVATDLASELASEPASGLPSEFVVASLRAPIAEGPGWSWWPPGGKHGDPDAEWLDSATAAVTTWLDALPFTPSQIGAFGFSQGGAMALHLLRRDLARTAFAVNLAGFVISGAQESDAALAVSRPPVFWGRGAEDELFLGDMAELVDRTTPWLAAHATAETHVYPGLGHSVSRDELDDVAAFLRARSAGNPAH